MAWVTKQMVIYSIFFSQSTCFGKALKGASAGSPQGREANEERLN